ncbi:MAG: PfkB family carbohydrate kinase [Acetanaerobacterium sp.]
MSYDIYLYGMIILSHSFLLKGNYPAPDSYAEIAEKYVLSSGETGTCAAVLASLGCRVKIDGNHLGCDTREPLLRFFGERGVDTSRLVLDPGFEGLKDYVIIDHNTRTCFGQFGQFFQDSVNRWSLPQREDILHAKAVGIDPFIEDGALIAARCCHEAGIPYVTIDCRCDSELASFAGVNAISGEFLRGTYADEDREALLRRYTEHTDGLVIFTGGGGEILYARRGTPIRRMPAFRVEVVSTLGAGDTFKAGCVYALHKGMRDDDLVRFAAATAGDAVTRFPIPLHPPTLERVERLLNA